MKPILAIDLGATTTRAASIDGRGSMLAVQRFDTPESWALLENRLADAATQLRSDSERGKHSFDAVYMAVPGILAAEGTTVERSIGVSWLEGVPLVAMLEQRLQIPARLTTDAAAATFGEYLRSPAPCAVFAHLRLGTGVAVGLIVEGQWQELPRPTRGHPFCLALPADIMDARCPCGQRGCLEIVASGPALKRAAHAAGYAGRLATLQQAFKRGEPQATKIVQAASAAVLHVVDRMIREWCVEAVVIGGGVCSGLPGLAEMLLRDAIDERNLPMAAARLGDDAGVMGVARACRRPRLGIGRT